MAKSYYILPKTLHFSIFAASSFYAPYLAVFFRYLGFSTVQIGVLTSLFPFVSMLGTMFWSGVADKQRRHRTILLVLIACTMFTLIFYTIHPLVKNFALLLILHLILSFFSSPISSIVDSFVLAILGMNNEKELYGQQRLWAAISWGLCSFISGIIIDHWPIETIFYAGALGYFASFLIVLLLLKINDLNSILKSEGETMKEMDKDASPKIADDVSTTSEPVDLGPPVEPTEIMVVPSFWTSFKTLLSVQFIFFNVTVMMLGMGVAVIGNFLFIFLRTDLNASGLLLGVDMIFTVLLELPFFFFGKQLLEKIGIRWMMVASTASLVIRSFGYCIIPSAWWVLPFELFHGLMFAAFWTAGVQYASDIAPPGLEATAQGVFNASFSGLGLGIGAIIGGVVYQTLGPYILFFGTGVWGLIALGFFMATYKQVDQEKTVHGKHQQIPRSESTAELKTLAEP
jgi:MFS family permease